MNAVTGTVVAELFAIASFVGKPLGPTAWRTIDQASIAAFGQVTGDEQWIHVDAERAATGPFGTTIAHGFLTLSLCSCFLFELLEIRGAGMLVNYGLDRVRFPAPVSSGTRVRARGEIVSTDDIPGGAQVVVRITVEPDGGTKPACVADLVLRALASQGT